MNKYELQKRIDGLNEYMLSDSDKKILTKTGIQLITRIALKLGMKLKPL